MKVFFCVFLSLWLVSLAVARPKYNVLLLSVDTLRADHLGCYGYAKPTPAFDNLARKAVVFRNAISQAPLTLPSHCTILSGLYPDQHGVRNNENFVLPGSVETLAEVFRENHYATGAVVGSFSLDSSFGLNQGFQMYDDRIGPGHDPEINRNVERRAATVWAAGRKWIDSQKSPWFCFLHFFDPHTAYNPPASYPQSYDGEIQYVDTVLSDIVAYLQQKNLLATTIFVLVSDHGESLGEHGETSHGVFLYDATLHVPLMILAPGLVPASVTAQVRLVDVAPTIAALAGLAQPSKYSGQSLLPFIKGAQTADLAAYSETYYTNLLMGWAPLHSIRAANKKWIDAPKPEWYDLKNDPRELKNLYTSASVPREFRAELGAHAKTQAVAGQRAADPELQEKLASLGYVTGGSAKATQSGMDPKDGIGVWTSIEQAVVSAQMGNLAQSKRLFGDALRKQPDNVIALKFFAAVLQKNGEPDAAIGYLKSALKSDLHRNETRYQLASLYFEKRQYPQVVELLQPVIKDEPQNWRALKMAAESWSFLNQDAKALDAYNRLAAAHPLTEEDALQISAIHLTAKNIAAAEKYFRLAAKLNPQSQRAWKGIGLIAASREQWSNATEAFLKAGDCAGASQVFSKLTKPSPPLSKKYHEQCK